MSSQYLYSDQSVHPNLNPHSEFQKKIKRAKVFEEDQDHDPSPRVNTMEQNNSSDLMVTMVWARKDIMDSPVVPEPRSFHISVVVSDTLWISGGRNAVNVMDDLFSFSLLKHCWVQHPSPQVARAYHIAVYDVVRHRLVLHGGKNLSPLYYDTIAAFNFDTKLWEDVYQVNPPGARGYHAGTMTGPDTFICVGGHNGVMWYDVASEFNFLNGIWRHIALSYIPPNIRKHRVECTHPSCIECPKCQRCGGVGMCRHRSLSQHQQHEWFATNCGIQLSNQHTFCSEDFQNNAPWVSLGSRTRNSWALTMPPRDGHTLTNVDGRLLVYGGELSKSFYDTVLSADVEKEEWTTLAGCGEYRTSSMASDQNKGTNLVCHRHQGPAHRSYHSAWGDSESGVMAVWGGYLHVGMFYNDLHCFDPKTGEWVKGIQTGDVPMARASATTTLIPSEPHRIVLFGGDAGTHYFSEVYVGEMRMHRSMRYLISRALSEVPRSIVEQHLQKDESNESILNEEDYMCISDLQTTNSSRESEGAGKKKVGTSPTK